MRGCARKARSVARTTAPPPMGRYCLGTSAPARSPRPAATMTAATVSIIGHLASICPALSHVLAAANAFAGLSEFEAVHSGVNIALQHLRRGQIWLNSMQ